MKTPTINNYLETFLNPGGRFKTLSGMTLLRDEAGLPRYTIRSRSVDFAILYGEKPAVACCPSERENPFELREYVKDRYHSAGTEEPTLLLNELLVFNDRGESAWRNLWIAEVPDRSFFCNEKTKEASPTTPATPYDLKTSFYEGLAAAEQEGKYGYVDRDGKTVVPFRYDWADAFDEGLALVKAGDLFGLIDKTGREVLAPVYEDIRWRSANGVIPACGEDGAWKLYDREGAAVSENTFDFISGFSCDLASVRREDKHGYIDRIGEIVIPPIYDEAYSFSEEGLATVVKNGITFAIDTEGMVFD